SLYPPPEASPAAHAWRSARCLDAKRRQLVDAPPTSLRPLGIPGPRDHGSNAPALLHSTHSGETPVGVWIPGPRLRCIGTTALSSQGAVQPLRALVGSALEEPARISVRCRSYALRGSAMGRTTYRTSVKQAGREGIRVPEVSVIVLTYNSAPHLAGCLNGLRQQTRVDFEVIVVDNASNDGSADLAERCYPDAVIVRNATNSG